MSWNIVGSEDLSETECGEFESPRRPPYLEHIEPGGIVIAVISMLVMFAIIGFATVVAGIVHWLR
jgi:hypothetical protein